MNHRSPSAVVIIATVVAMMTIGSADARPGRRHQLLESTTIDDWRAARMDATGCYWSARTGGPVLFAAAGRTAVTRIAGRVVTLAPARQAKEMFPWTYDAWTFRGLTIRIIDGRAARAIGYESVTTDATVIVSKDGRVTRMRGSMICGS
jgi:hypothetical protein